MYNVIDRNQDTSASFKELKNSVERPRSTQIITVNVTRTKVEVCGRC